MLILFFMVCGFAVYSQVGSDTRVSAISEENKMILEQIKALTEWPESSSTTKEGFYQRCETFFTLEEEYIRHPSDDTLTQLTQVATDISNESRNHEEKSIIEDIATIIANRLATHKIHKGKKEIEAGKKEIEAIDQRIEAGKKEIEAEKKEIEAEKKEIERKKKISQRVEDIKHQTYTTDMLIKQGYEIIHEAEPNDWLHDGGPEDELFRIYAKQLGIKID